jgi:pimeloyl-ACP methyl ester carboxylesterase
MLDRPLLPPHSQLTLRDGRTLAYRIFGDPNGRPVVACHGAPATSILYEIADVPARRLGLRLIAPTRPGYDRSSPQPGRTLADATDDVRQLLAALGIDGPFAALGISGGGPYATALAAAFPDRCRELRLISPVGELAALPREKFIDWLQARFFLDLPRRRYLDYVAPLAFRVHRLMPWLESKIFRLTTKPVDRAILDRPEVKESIERMSAEAMSVSFDGGVSDLKIYGRAWGFQAETIKARTVIWQGDADTVVPPEAAHALAARIPKCTLHRLKGAGHFWIYDHVDEVLATLS